MGKLNNSSHGIVCSALTSRGRGGGIFEMIEHGGESSFSNIGQGESRTWVGKMRDEHSIHVTEV